MLKERSDHEQRPDYFTHWDCSASTAEQILKGFEL
jgi:hypothetical protein